MLFRSHLYRVCFCFARGSCGSRIAPRPRPDTPRPQVGFKSFLNITPNVVHGAQPPASSPTRTSVPSGQANAPGASFSLTFDENPLAEFVELPEEALEGGLWFSNVLCGVLRGALEMVRSFH